MRIILGVILLSVMGYSCSFDNSKSSETSKPANQITTPTTAKPLIRVEQLLSNEGFINIPLNIVEQRNKDGYFSYRIQALYKTDTLELIVSLKEGVGAGLVDGAPEKMFLMDGIIFESTGAKSDRLLTTLAQKYQINSGKLTMKSKQAFTCANFNKTAVDYESGTPKFKIFLEGNGEVAELYVNFDFNKSVIFLNEKDPQYRNELINLLKE